MGCNESKSSNPMPLAYSNSVKQTSSEMHSIVPKPSFRPNQTVQINRETEIGVAIRTEPINQEFSVAVQPSSTIAGYIPPQQIDYKTIIKQTIDSIIAKKNLHHFYPNGSANYYSLIDFVSNINFVNFAHEQSESIETALDYVALCLFDVYIFIDDSGSMNFDENGDVSNKKRDDLRIFAKKLASVVTKFDTDGITLASFNNPTIIKNVSNAQTISDYVQTLVFEGSTPLGKELERKILYPLASEHNEIKKPIMIYIITDGEPDNKQEVKDIILKYKNHFINNELKCRSTFNIMFAQVGCDTNATNYLSNELDKDLVIGSEIDTIGSFEHESVIYRSKGKRLTVNEWINRVMLGGLLEKYDIKND